MGRISGLFGMVAVSALLSAGPALSAAPSVSLDAQQDFHIPSQSLDTALLLYSRQTGLQIISSTPVVANKTAPALSGVKTPRQALVTLLQGSNLSYVVSGNTITIVPGSTARSTGLVPTALQTPDSVVRAGPFDAAPSGLLKIADQTAQTVQSAPSATASTGGPPSAAPEVVVTGSRIVRNGYSAPTPVTVITADQLLATAPFSLADGLNQLPEFSPQFNPSSNAGAAAPSGNYLNLRGLGQNRTLVLLDGVRVPATNTTGTVDTNTLPQALVQRVDVVTGGASAVYGSDAVGGVVNYILNTNFNGLKVSAQSGISTYGDAPSDKFTVAFGTHVGDLGHAEFSYEHAVSAGINQSDRGFTSDQPGFVGAGTAASPYYIDTNLRMATTTMGGYIQTATAAKGASLSSAQLTAALAAQGSQFVGNALVPFTAGTQVTTATSGGLQSGGSGAYVTGGQLVKPQSNDNLFARFDYDLAPKVTAYAQVAAGLSQTNYLIPPAALSTTVISGNPYLPQSVQSQLTAASTTGPTGSPATFTMSSLAQNLANMQQTNQWASDVSASFGLKGKAFDDNYNWNATYTHGQGITHVETNNQINTSHYYAALDAVQGPNGTPVCYISTQAAYASQYQGCVPLNLIGSGNESPAALAYIMQNTAYDIINRTDELNASISGTAFQDWAGPVSVAANAETRWMSLEEGTDAPPSCTPDLNGLRQTWTATGLKAGAPTTCFLGTTTASQRAADSVWEFGGETVVPLLKDFTLVKDLEFSGALRYTQYSVSGPAITWKAGLNYQPIDDVRFRITESRDIRAPTLYELFQAPSSTTISNYVDPLTNQVQQPFQEVSGGNTNVKPEVATTNTLGVVYSPSWFRGFRASVDYYDVDIRGAISNSLPAIGTAGITDDVNTCDQSGGTSIYCQAIVRGTVNGVPNQIVEIHSYTLNLAEQYVRGVDLEASYDFKLRDIQPSLVGQVGLRFLMTYAPTNVTIASPGASPAGSPLTDPLVTKATTSINYNLGPFQATWQIIYTDSYKYATPTLTPVYYLDPIAPATIVDNVNLSYRFKAQGHDLQAFFNVANLFNQTPNYLSQANDAVTVPGAQTPLNASISPLGRYFTGGIRATF